MQGAFLWPGCTAALDAAIVPSLRGCCLKAGWSGFGLYQKAAFRINNNDGDVFKNI
jgi:hypothetical protein